MASGRRCQTAMFSASSTSSVRRCVAIDHQIGRLLTLVVLDGGAGSLPSADALQARLTHQAGHPLATHPDAALSLEFGMDPGRAVGASGVLVNRSHPLQKHRILPRPLRPA